MTLNRSSSRSCSRSSLLGRGLLLGNDRGVLLLAPLGNEAEQIIEGTITLVVDELTGSSGLELESGETLDLEGGAGGEVVKFTVHLGEDDALVSGEGLAEGLPCGKETLAVTAPDDRKTSTSVNRHT